MLQQAWNLQWEHNKNRKAWPRGIGDLNWAFFDGLAGLVVGIEGWGVADIFRIPKFSYSFFQSQRSAAPGEKAAVTSGPMVSISHYWQKPNRWQTVPVYSNCDKVALFLDNKLLGIQKPDSGPETGYGDSLETGGNPFDGGNANHLQHPPFTFKNISFRPGTLKAVGYINGKMVAADSVATAGDPGKIQLVVAENGKPLKRGIDDIVFVYAKITDVNKNLVVSADHAITLTVQGNAALESPATVDAEAGIATFLLRVSKNSGPVFLTATSPVLPPVQLQVL